MIALAWVAAYLLAGLVTVAVADRWLDFDTSDDADIIAAAGLLLCWPLVAVIVAVAFLAVAAIRLARGVNR